MTDMRQQLVEAQRKLIEVLEFFDRIEKLLNPAVAVPLEVADAGLQNPAAFYDYIRGDAGELFPTITQDQINGCNRLLAAGAGKLPLSWCAYLLATVYHETAKRMQPVVEGLSVSDAWRRKHLRYYPWHGRGDIQLTWERNYVAAGKLVGVDLVADPNKALDPGISARIAVEGMLKGLFTGKSLRDYLPAKPELKHYINARRIINGTDKAALIAGYAVEFEKALKLGDWR